jgi:pimeloyl-ACP methyl ester carboxylesterase
MTAYCLLHGSGQGPEGWRLLAEALERRGHAVLTPAFDVDATDEGALWHAETLVASLEDSGWKSGDTVLVAHSGSGMFLPLVADRWPARRMVFLAALVPRPGSSIRQLSGADASMFNPAWLRQDPKEDQVAREYVFHDCPLPRLAWAMSTRIVFHARRALEEPCPLTTWPAVPASYIACAEDRTLSPAWQCRVAREWLGVEPIVLPGGHCPHVSRPEALADALERLEPG